MPDWFAIVLKVMWGLMVLWAVWMCTYMTWHGTGTYRQLRMHETEEEARFGVRNRSGIRPVRFLVRILSMWLFTCVISILGFYWLFRGANAS